MKTSVVFESWYGCLRFISIPGAVDTISYILAGLAAANYTPDPATDALARYVKRRQAADGGWRIATQRPPIESSDLEVTAMALRALQVYAPNPQKEEYAKAVQKGAIWLSQAQPRTTEDHAFLLLGLGWARENKGTFEATHELLTAGRMAVGPSFPRSPVTLTPPGRHDGLDRAGGNDGPGLPTGSQFLLNRQLEDGSWYVTTRAIPASPISTVPSRPRSVHLCSGDRWATMALARAAKSTAS